MGLRDRRDVQRHELLLRKAIADVAAGKHERRRRLLAVDPLKDDLFASREIVLAAAIPGRIDAGVVEHEAVAGVAERGELAPNRLQVVVPVGDHDAGRGRDRRKQPGP